MPRRVLISIEDTGVAHVVAARLMKDGVDGVVVGRPQGLVEETKGGVSALVVQDRYATGEAGASLLRQVRAATGGAVPAVYLISDEIAAADRHVLERQYRVAEFLPVSASPHSVASALLAAAGPNNDVDIDLDADVVLHEDEAHNEFDIEINSQAEMNPISAGIGFDDEGEAATVEVSLRELKAKIINEDSNIATELPTRRVHDEVTRGNPTMQAVVTKLGEAMDSAFDRAVATDESLTIDLLGMSLEDSAEGDALPPSTPAEARSGVSALDVPMDGPMQAQETGVMELSLPIPGTSLDLQIPVLDDVRGDEGLNETAINPLANLTEAEDLEQVPRAVPQAFAPQPLTSPGDQAPLATEVAPDAEAANEDEMQQLNELKKALVVKKRQLDGAQKRIEELEAKLATANVGGTPIAGDGLPSEGVFEEIRYPSLLARARNEAFTGSIRMQLPGDTTRTIYVKNGLPVGFTTSEPGEKIGKVLVSQGRISDDQYVKAATRMVERGIKLSEALVDLGLIDAETLDVEIRNLTRDQIIAGFELVQGRFTVQTGETPPDRVPTFDFGPGEIYVQGFRQYAPRAEMHALYEQLRPKYLTANARLPVLRPKLGLGGDDERLLRLLGEAYTVEEAVDRAKVDPDEAARLIASMQALDLVEEWNPGVEQFRARLSSERQHFAEEIARLREESAAEQRRLIEGFERALTKITAAVEGGGAGRPHVKLADVAAENSAPITSAPAVKPLVSSVTTAPPPTSKPVSRPEPKLEPVRIEAPTLEPEPPPPVAVAVPATPSNGALKLAPGGIALIDAAAYAREPTSPADSKFHEAARQAADNRLDEAELTLREAVRMDAARPEFLTALARVLLANPRYERAGTLPVVKSLLDRAVTLSPGNTEARKLHQEVLLELGA
jgi:hypothetical protein